MQGLRRLVVLFLSFAVLVFAAPVGGHAQSAEQPAAVKIDKRKLLVQPRNEDGTVQAVSIFEDPVLWVRDKQQAFYGQMAGALRKIRTGSTVAAAWTLILLSFGYGVFHAAGPGHGKAVISTWLLATESELRRGILISFVSAIIQALTAIAIVTVLFLAVASVGASARSVAGGLESASYALIGVMGLYLIWTAFKGKSHKPAPASLHTTVASQRDATQRSSQIHHFDSFQPHAQEPPPHDHVHGPDCGCGHAHLPEARQLRGDWSLAKAMSLSFAVGIRPCTGAILVLVFANAMGLYWAGIASTFAMAIGTFITVSVIATIAVYARKAALHLSRRNTFWMDWLSFGLRLGGGAFIAFLGAVLFMGSLGTVDAMM